MLCILMQQGRQKFKFIGSRFSGTDNRIGAVEFLAAPP